MHKAPRNIKTQPLVVYQIVIYSYLFYGTLESIAAFFVYFLYMYERGPHTLPNPVPTDDDGERTFPVGYTQSQLMALGISAQTMANWVLMKEQRQQLHSLAFLLLSSRRSGVISYLRRKSPYFFDAIMNTQKSPKPSYRRFWDELVQTPPRIPIVAAIFMSALTASFFTEIPSIQQVCGTCTGSVPAQYWLISIALSIAIFFVAEIRK